MSGQGCDVAKIQDEDVLRKMWQETEDFGRKKEIRAHMYKIREARLREFYNSGEVSKDIQRTHSSPGLREKGMAATHHADSLMDHSFLSLKSKEIRDSESPTRDITYRIGDVNKGWTVRESNERSADGKTHSTSRVASTSGKEKIQGGDLNYAAKSEQHASVYQDGDDKNFTRAVGTSSSSAIKQEARGGNENSQFYSTSSKTQSSSKFVSEHKSSSIPESQTIVRTSYTSQVPEEIIRHTDQSQNVRNTTYTSNVPEELKKHPSYVEGKTKVYTETKTLPDGSTVTTTRYETVGGKNTSQTSSFSTKRVSSSNEQKYSTENVQRSTQSTDLRQLETYSHPEIEVQCVTSTNRKQRTDTADTRDHRVSQNIKQQQATEEKVDRSSRIDVHTSKTTDQRQVHKSEDVRNTIQQTVRKGDTVEVCKISKLPDEIVVTRTHPVDQSTVKTTVVKTVENKHDESKRIASDFINVEKHHEQVVQKAPVRDAPETCKRPVEQAPKAPVKETPESPPKYEQPERRFESPVREAPSKRPQEESPKYEQPERRQPIKPAKSEMDTKPKPTEGQYSTTYRSEFTNKKISVEVSPTHDAFARSLRSVTPERDRPSKCSSPTRSFRTSTSSIRSTTTPERMRHPTRYSPDRRGTSPRKSPDQTYHRRRQDETTRTTTEVDSSTLTRRPKKKPSSRGSSPTDTVSDFEYRTRQEIVTDLDDEIDVQRKTTVDRRPNNLDLTTTRKVKKITERSPTSPISDTVRRTSPSPRRSSLKTTRPTLSSPTKQSPSDFKPFIAKTEKVLRRTDTYEERCRQILGIAEKKKVERNISDIILTDRTRPKSPEKKSPTKESPRKPALPDAARRPSPDKYSPAKEPTSPTRQFPDKSKSPSKHIKEFPSQVRRTPEKQPLESYPKRKSPTKEGPQLKEFPAQSRKTPTKQPLEPYPQRKSPVKDAPQFQEFPAQSRKTPTKQPLEPYPQRKSPVKDAPQVQEFPAQIRKSPVKEPLEPLPKRQSPVKERPQINEFPVQIRKTPTKEPQEPQQQRKSPVKEAPQIGEFPAQIRKTPERQTHPAPKQSTEPTRKEPTEKKPNVVDDLICITRDEDVRRFTTQKEHEILSTVRKDTRVVEEPQRKLPKKPKTTTDEETTYIIDVDEEDTTIRQHEDFTTREIEEIIRQQKTQIRPSVTTDVIVKSVDDTTKIEENTTTTQIDEFPSQRRPSNPTTGANVTSTVETTKIINVNEQRKVPITTETTTTTQKVKDFSSQPKSPSKPHEESPSQKKSSTKLVTDTDVTKTTRVETTRIIDVDEEDTIYPSNNKRPSKPATTKDRVTEQTTTTTTHRFEEYPTQQKKPTTQETTNITDVHSRDVTTKTIEEFPSQRKSPAKPTAPVDVTVCTTKQTTRIQEDTTSQKIKELPSERKPTTMPKTTTEKPKNTEGVPSQNKYPTEQSVTPVAPKPDKDEIPTRPTEEYPDQTTVTDVKTRNRQTTSTTKVEGIQRTTEDFLVTQTSTKPSKKNQPKQHKDRKIPALKDTEDTSSDEEEETTDVTETSVTQFLDECLDEHTENTTVTSVEKFLVAEKDVTQSTQKKEVVDIGNDRKVQPKPKVDEIKESPKTKPSRKVDKPKSVTEIFIETEKVGSTNRTREEVFVDQTDKTVTISKVSDVRTTGHVPSKPKPQRPNQNVDNYPSKTATAPNQRPKTQKPLPKPDEIITPKKYTPSKQVKQPIPREPSQEEIIAHSIQYSYGAREPVDEPMMVEKKMFKVMDDEEEDIKTRVKDFIVHEQVDFEVKQSPERLSPVRRVPSGNQTKPKPAQKDLPRKTTTVTQKPVEVTKRKPKTIVKQTKVVPKTVVVTTCKVDLVDARKANGVPGKPTQVKPKVGAAPVKGSGVPKKPATPTPDRRVKPVDVRPTTKTSSVKTEQVNRKEVVIEIKSPKKVVEQPKKKLVSTTINLSTKPRTTGVEPRKKSPVKERTPKLKPLQNGHRYTDEDDDVVPTRKPLRPSPVKQDTTKTQRKCVTTKSIIIKSAVADEREIIVDLQRSKSSREETPDRIWPITNEEDSGIPRYPDQIVEPDEPVLKKPQKLSDIPLTEGEDVNDFNRFTELIDAKITEVDRVQETDECLLTVNEKVNKFLHTADQRQRKVGPAPKVDRPQLVIDESLKSDECLLSVTDKVNKFITTAEKLKVVDVPERPKSPRCRNFEQTVKETVCEDMDEKIHKFIESTEKLTTKREKSPPKKIKPETPVEGTFETPKNTKFPTGVQEPISVKSVESTPKSRRNQEDKPVSSTTTRLRSTETIKKARALFEKVDKTDVERKHLNSAKKTLNYEDDLTSRKVVNDTRRSKSPADKDVPSHMRDVRPKSPHKETPLQRPVERTTPHYMAPLEKHVHHTTESLDEEKIVRHPVDGAVPHYMAPLDRASHDHAPFNDTQSKSTRHVEEVRQRFVEQTDGVVPHYMAPLDRAPHEHSPSRDTQPNSTRHVEEVKQRFVELTDENVPHYMAPLDRVPHDHAPSKDTQPKSTRHVEEVRQRFVEQIDGTVPHYMAPLDRVPHEHTPLKDTQPKSTRHVEEVRQRFVEQTDGTVPHYMAPLDRAPHEHTPMKDTQPKSTRHVEEVRQRFVEQTEGTVPHYMAPLDRVPHDHLPSNETQLKSTRHVEEVRQRFVEQSEGPVPHYMAPLDRAPHEHIPSQETQPKSTRNVEEIRQRFLEHSEGPVPHYMAPLHRGPHEHAPTKDLPKTTRHVEDVRQRLVEHTDETVPHYMAPLDRSHHEHSHTKDTSPKSRHVEEVRQRFVEQTEGAVPHYMAPLDRAPHEHTPSKDTLAKTTRHTEEVRQRFVEQTNESVPHYMTPLDRSHHEHTQSKSTRHEERFFQEIEGEDSPELSGPDGDVPGYMKQLDRSLRTRSPHKDSVAELEEISKGHVPHEETGKTTKFGVVLKRTDSGRIERRRSSTTVTVEVEGSKKELEIEEIYDLQLLEKMLEKVVGYELRRRVRSQIRIVKKLISENKLQSVTTKKVKSKSPDKIIKTQEVHTTYKTETRRSPSPGSKANPERVQVTKSKKPETKVTPDLKRTSAPQKSPAEDKPEWAVQRNLKKVSEQVAPKKVTSATTVKQTQEVTTVRKTVKPEKQTDTITSSYGVGPTDENGSPLFGLRALRAQNKNETTKVQGTVMHSTFYSENGSEPVGEISLTQYSTDPKDLGSPEDLECHGEVLAKTTTKKFGQTRKAITDKKKIEDDKVRTTTTKVTRKGSVKEISQKFLDNAVETLKSEKQTSYPRAGLILRTSGFKEGSGSSREGSPIESEEVQRTVQVESSSTGSFLTNTSRVTGAQDVIDRMRVEEYREEDTLEDAEARNTLNKFLGSQVLLAGMESQMKMGMTSSRSAQASASTTTSGSLKQTTITTTITENGIPKTTTRTYTHPITPDVLETIWEEQSLRLLLEQSSEYEERRIIRARLKQVMAEKEACSEYVEKAIEESDSGNVQGESLLLPLLQGVLDAPEVEQTADSGTECGEDLRSGLIIEVQNALDKLSACLSSDSTDISPERRDSLLQLVTKLQTNLNIPSKDGVNLERRSSGQGRFSRRRQRPNRHTVGVTSEELEDARRLMEEIALRECINPLQKQNSEGSVQPNKPASFRPVKFQPHPPIKNAMPKPFSGSTNTSQSQSGTSSTVDTPTIDSLDLLYSEKPEDVAYFENATIQTNGVKSPSYNQSLSLDHDFVAQKRPLTQSMSLDFTPQIDPQSLQTIHAVHQAAILKTIKSEIAESETDEDSTIRNDKFETTNQLKEGDKVVLYDESVFAKKQYKPVEQETTVVPPPDLILQTNPVYANPVCFEQTDDKANKFNTKKIKMKRANTIDIPKPLNYYPIEDEDESDAEQEANKRRSNYLALRGPIRVGKSNNSNVVPAFEPKTESDKKFLAFINKHNETSGVAGKVNLWDKTVATKHDTGVNWQRKFGNLKTNFEQGEEKKNVSSARNFWKSADDAVAAGTPSYHGPKISRQNAKNLQQMFEQKQRQGKLPEERNVVTGSLKVDTKNLEPHKNYRFVPQPLPVNKFSHNPQSAFRPIQKTTPKPDNLVITKSAFKATPGSDASTPDTPLYLYSPKNFEPEQHSTPWSSTAKTGERRVLSLAASKFEQTPAEETKVKPRKVPKVTIPPVLQTVEVKEKLPAYMAPQSKVGGSVRKLSGQYDNMGSKPTHQSAFAPVVPKQQQLNGTLEQQYKPKPEPKYEAYTKVVQNYTKIAPEPPNYGNHYTTKAVLNHHPNPPNYASINHPTNTNPLKSIPPEHPSLIHRPELRTNIAYPAELPSHTISNQYSSEQPRYLNGADTLDTIPPSFHTTSPTVQHIQKTHSHPTNPHPEPHVYYNNVGDHQYTSYSQVTQRLARQPTPPPSPPPRPKYNSQVSQESLHEYTAISSKVMSGPVSQQAVTVQQNTPKNRNEHDMDAALNLKSALQKIDKKSPSPREPVRPNFCVNDKPVNLESLEVNDRGETIVTSKFQIPMKSENRQGQILSKCDSWHQICQDNQAKKPSPRSSPNARSIVKSKSTHTLALPKQFEAGMSKDEMQHKKRTMEAYFSTSPQTVHKTKRSINRVKTADKISISTGLCRSRTLPDIVCPDLLDETNVDEAFEDLFKSSA